MFSSVVCDSFSDKEARDIIIKRNRCIFINVQLPACGCFILSGVAESADIFSTAISSNNGKE